MLRTSGRWVSPLSLRVAILLALLAMPFQKAMAQQSSLSPGAGFTVDDYLDVASARVMDLSADGRWLAVTVSSLRDGIGTDNYRTGDPTYVSPGVQELWVIDTRSGDSRRVFSGKRTVRRASWSPDGRYLAIVEARAERFSPWIWDREGGRDQEIELPQEHELAGMGGMEWTPDGGSLLMTLWPEGWREEARSEFYRLTKGPILVQSSEEPFLAWDALRRMSRTRSLVRFDVAAGQSTEILPTLPLGGYRLTEDGAHIVYDEDITEETSYEVIFGSTSTVKVISVEGGEPETVIETTADLRASWSPDGRFYAFTKNGNVFVASLDDPEPVRLTGEDEEGEGEGEEDEEVSDEDAEEERERYSVSSVGPEAERIVASSRKGLWILERDGEEPYLFLERDEDDDFAPQYRVTDWSPDGASIYLTYASRKEWERGLFRYDIGSRQMTELVKNDRVYSGWRLSEDGSTFVFSSGANGRPSDLYAADAEFRRVHRLTEVNPDIERKSISETELFTYLDVDGNTLNGVIYYPAGYQEGVAYPTVFIVYESFFDPRFNGTVNVLTNNGYLVVNPSVELEIGYPGEAWIKGVTAAANKLIEMGLADADRLAVHGTSYGGYATNLLVTQTDRFKAAINISGKVDMISFYTDSPRLGVRNIHAPENSQDRLGATLWEQPQKYVAHSAIMFADRIDTPLLLMTGEQDHNVPARTTMEMFYALRRLGKTVEWVNYIDGGHGMPRMSVEMVHDYHQRILDWYERYLIVDEDDPKGS